MTKSWEKQLRVLLGYEIHVETILISTDFLGHTHTETISTWNNNAIINHLSHNDLNCFIFATKAYLCLCVSILWSDLERVPVCAFGTKYRYLLLELVQMFTIRVLNLCLNF